MERVFVGNLPPDIRIKDIDDFFRPFGKLIYIDVNHNANPVHAFVQFDSARNAFNAVKSRHGFNFEGYNLQLRLVENEVRKGRDATPPPPPPPIFSDSIRGNNMGNGNKMNRSGLNFPTSSMSSSSSSQWSSNNRSNLPQQQDMMGYQRNNRGNIQQQQMQSYQPNDRSNMQQPYSNSNRSNMPQQYSNSNRSNMQQQFSNSNRSNMQQQYSNSNRSNMQQQYSNSNRSNMQQQNFNMSQQNMGMGMNTYSNNSSWDVGNNGNWNSGNNNNNWRSGDNNNWGSGSNNNNNMSIANTGNWNSGNDMSNMGWNLDNESNYNNNSTSNNLYYSNNDPYSKVDFKEKFTQGFNGSCRKWFNRYINKGFSPEMARKKALEHKNVPYQQQNDIQINPNPTSNIPDDPTNVALETIGNTILSLLSTNSGDNFNTDNQMISSLSNWSGDFNNSNISGPSTSRSRGDKPRNRVSKQQYLKSLDILKNLRSRRSHSAKDRLSKKYHLQIVKDYEDFEKPSSAPLRVSTSNTRNDKPIASTSSQPKSYSELSMAFRKKKQQLFLAAKRDPNKRMSGAYMKRIKVLVNECGFLKMDAKMLAFHPFSKLQSLIDLKKEYDNASKKKSGPLKTRNRRSSKKVAYRNDINYLKNYEKQSYESLSERVKTSLRSCLTRIHKHEKDAKMPLTKTKFVKLLPRSVQRSAARKKTKKTTNDNKPKASTTAEKEEKLDKKPVSTSTNDADVAAKEIKEENNKETTTEQQDKGNKD